MKVKTDKLIDMLSANLEPVRGGQFAKALSLAVLVGGAAAVLEMWLIVGPRPDLGSTVLTWTAVKLVFALSVVVTGAALLLRTMRPGLETHWALVLWPFVTAIGAALATLLVDTPGECAAMVLGPIPLAPAICLVRTIFFASIPLAALIWALRKGAPTQLKLCGTVAGMVAGGLGASAYALSCRADAILFIAVWYSAAILLCAVIGAQLGPRLLRW